MWLQWPSPCVLCSIPLEVLFDEMKVADPNSEPLLIADGTEKAARRRAKLRSVSMTSISAMLEAEADPVKRELLQLVRDWLSARTQEKRGGFLGSGELSNSYVCPAGYKYTLWFGLASTIGLARNPRELPASTLLTERLNPPKPSLATHLTPFQILLVQWVSS